MTGRKLKRLQDLLTSIRLLRSKTKDFLFILPDNKIHHPIAKIANTVKQNNGMIHPVKLLQTPHATPYALIPYYETPSAHRHPAPVFQSAY